MQNRILFATVSLFLAACGAGGAKRTDAAAASSRDSAAMSSPDAAAASSDAAVTPSADAAQSDAPGSDAARADTSSPADAAAPDAPGSDATRADASAPDAVAACPPQTGAGTNHQGVIEADQTWTAAAGPHVVTFDLHVNRGTLTIEPCAVVRIKKGYTISVGGGNPDSPMARLVARGTAAQPILFTRADANDPWGMVAVNASATVDLEQVTLSGGGDHATAQDGGGILKLRGPGGQTPLRNTRVKNVRIEGAAGYGVNVTTAGGFTTDSSDLVITNCGRVPGPAGGADTRYPIFVTPPSIQALPAGTFTGNAQDQILVGSAMPEQAEAFHDRGIPYLIDGRFVIKPAKSAAEGGLATLTIEAGVKILLANEPTSLAELLLGASSGPDAASIWPVKLLAAGTAERPIVLSSATAKPAAGDWAGVHWAGGPATGNVMSYVRVEYAGSQNGTGNFGCGPSDNDAAILITNWRPDEAFMKNVTISDSAGGGIVCGWISDKDGPDFKTGNTFTRIGNGCAVARWMNATPPACPGNTTPICL